LKSNITYRGDNREGQIRFEQFGLGADSDGSDYVRSIYMFIFLYFRLIVIGLYVIYIGSDYFDFFKKIESDSDSTRSDEFFISIQILSLMYSPPLFIKWRDSGQ
jgi:hypothetical protein